MDNVIQVYSAREKYRINRRKRFTGHLVAGYACQPACSPDGQFVVSGDADGRLSVWDFTTTRMAARLKAHDKVLMDVQWLPQETSKLVTCSWDGSIKLWD